MFELKTDPITLTHAHKLADVLCVIFAPALAFFAFSAETSPASRLCAWLRHVRHYLKKERSLYHSLTSIAV